jgi:hypothetical protein
VTVEFLPYAFGAAGVMWITGWAIGLAFGMVRRLRDVV